MTDTILCIDIGTTSLKAALITALGEVVSVSSYKYAYPEERFVAESWYGGLKSAFKKLCRKFHGDVRICALSISGNGPTVVLENGITALWKENHYFQKERIGSSLFMSNILFLKEKFPEYFERSRFVFSGPEYLIYKLTGNAVTILPEKRFISAYWDEEALKREKISVEKMPPFMKPGQSFGKVSSECMKELELNQFAESELPVFGAGPDFVAALIGTNTLQAGRICDRSGSSEGLNFCVPAFVQAEGLRTLPSVIPGLWNVSALIPNSSRIPREERLIILKELVEKLKNLAIENNFDFPKTVVATGGQTKDSLFMKKKAKALGLRLSVCKEMDSELLGDACVAWYGLGLYSSLQEAACALDIEGRVYEDL